MYAVEKLSSYISRGVYTVSGPFHPFGGAVDIIVVQQQDGSFKSSPWYVRFGKFQGVLKTKEKLVDISVNGVEAGFNMYLDHKGEAFFLKDAENGEQDFVLSPPTSGDEAEGSSKNGRFKNVQSFDIEGRQNEIITQVDNGNGNLLTQTSSRRSTIFGLVFGQRSFKENDKGGNVEKVSSFEHANMAADLLEVKWSTNMISNERVDQVDHQATPGNKSEMNVCVADEEESSQTALPKDSESIGDNYEKNVFSGDCSEQAGNIDPSYLIVSEETVEMHTSETGDKAISDQKNAGFVFSNHVVDTQICSLDFSGSLDDSFVSHDEGLGDTHIHKNNKLTENSFEDITSHEEVVQIYTSEVSDTPDRNKSTSELVTVQSNETNAENPALPQIYDDKVGSHTESHVGSTASISKFETRENEITSFSYCQIESSTIRLNLSGEETSQHLGLFFGGSGLHKDTSNKVPEVSSLSLSAPSLCKDKDDFHNQILETSGDSESNASNKSQYDFPTSGALKDLDNNNFYTEPDLNSCSEQIPNGIHLLSNQQLPSYEHGCLPMEHVAEESSLVQDTNFQQIGFLESHLQMEERQAAQVPFFPASISSNPLGYSIPVKSHSFSETLDSCNSNNGVRNMENFDVGDNLKRSYSFNVNVAQDFGTISRSTEVAEHSAPCSESLEDVQFPFSDIENFGGKEINTELSNNENVGEIEHQETITSECDLEEHDLQIKDNKQSLEEESTAFRSHSSPINIPRCMTSYGENKLSSKSLPVVRSHIKDLEGSDHHHSLSCSLIEKTDISKEDAAAISSGNEENKLSSKSLPVIRSHIKDLEGSDHHHSLSCSLIEKTDISKEEDATISSGNEEDPKGILTNAAVELSLCRHLLFGGMGADAARQVFDTEKVNLEKFTALGPSLVKNKRLVVRVGDKYFPWDAAAPIVLGMICFGQKNILEPQGMIPVDEAAKKLGSSRSVPSRGSWNLWPFMKRSKTISNAHEASEYAKEMDDVGPASRSTGKLEESDVPKAKNCKKVQSLTPTSKELASLNLKEGQNMVTFSFSTSVLGSQQVDARIYLWKWNTRIVISDVDGTITKSDVLGQFMPLVGYDWSQTGVAHLFSAIKDNGYQLLFLSARAISQAHLTRQFLFNLKQDGKALPDGPVVISPDGLFPSLYREVIRRAPHEFKISCLEVIKALFPPDCNPFYAGFGNRDTDEFSYLKVGIPLGKIFIINPKGQVAVNRRVDRKSYPSLHELVNGIFPPMSSSEQEDYNSWNYWKLPLPEVDI
ncbi:hypothetical protein Cni_G11509 [Canna indica]|uniref:phosphatidate phosphatase n=1 Tax=Canna indica TaxID=4628 RepID=A0AAQ3QBT6_9LILI|nr:hypothetical protein Cni_G11509 [Canna indica]